MNAQAANLILAFGPEALAKGSAEPATVLLRAMLNAAPEDLQRFHGQIDFIFPVSEARHGVTDLKERACVEALVTQVPEILFFLPITNDSVPQLLFRLVAESAVSRAGSEMTVVGAEFERAKRKISPLLRALKKTMVRAGLSEESIIYRVDRILEMIGIEPRDRSEFLS